MVYQSNRHCAPCATLSFTALDWDSRFFQLNVYQLNVSLTQSPAEAIMPSCDLRSLIPADCDAFWAKIPATDRRLTAQLERSGAHLREVEINLCADGHACPADIPPGIRIEQVANPGDKALDFARCFTFDRFHTDPEIPTEKADALWQQYLLTYSDSAARIGLSAVCNGRVAGFLGMGLHDELPHNTLDVIAVLPDFRGHGVGTALMRKAITLSAQKPLHVSTQHHNAAAINAYIRGGFTRYLSPRTVYHWWRHAV